MDCSSCLVKLYYPEPESARVAALVQGKPVCHNSLHELEFHKALQLKGRNPGTGKGRTELFKI
jgi:hypothetical protein